MSAYRTRKKHMVYARYTEAAKNQACQFCSLTAKSDQVAKEFAHFWLVKNIFPYETWDNTGVKDHLILIPKRHIDSIGKFKTQEGQEFVKLIGQYDQQGYSVYARSPNNIIKSVPHQHTHLIAVDNKPKKFLFFIKKPHFLITK